ncbi:hypothetical protein [Humibacter sp.]|uniref:hypothetical protein n=1 Tax=Humibacter sp. TaxID=1940291 RepID=UPI003F7F3D7A
MVTRRALFAAAAVALSIEPRPFPTQLVQWKGSPGTKERLSVSTTGAGGHPIASTSVTLKLASEAGPCGTLERWGLNMRVDANGSLKTLGWTGSFLRPATQLPLPTTTQ